MSSEVTGEYGARGGTWEGLTPPYATIVADPPWQYQKAPGSKQEAVQRLDPGSRGGQAERQYSTLTNEQIATLPVRELAALDAHLFLWVTNPGIYGGRFSTVTPEAIAAAWGFKYQTMLTWVKVGEEGRPIEACDMEICEIFAHIGDPGIQPADRDRECEDCKGRGRGCSTCAGSGRIETEQQHARGNYSTLFVAQASRRWGSSLF